MRWEVAAQSPLIKEATALSKQRFMPSHLMVYVGGLLFIHLDPLSNIRTQIHLLNHTGLKV